jgi:uncharacterized protein YcfL|uniref:hypothetical protein n=1 Tax=Gelidibacter sp. TaxID=2018083 RepID=UPI00404981BF
MKKLGIVLILSILLVSCSKSESIGKYQAISLSQNKIIIINTITGEGEEWERSTSSGRWEYSELINEFKK